MGNKNKNGRLENKRLIIEEANKRILSESSDGGCKCPDGTVKPECCNTDHKKTIEKKKKIEFISRTKHVLGKGRKNVLGRKYFGKS